VLPFAIAAMPVLGVMRLTMGEEKFNAWLDSDIVRFHTNFTDQDELMVAVKKGGYDAAPWGKDSVKTHLNKEDWFFWEIYKNQWTMRINKSFDKGEVKKLMQAIEEKNGRQIFISARANNQQEKQQVIAPEVESALPTIYASQELLVKTLKQHGVQDLQVQQGQVLCNINGYKLKYYRNSDMDGVPYELAVTSRNDLRKLYSEITSLNECYQSNVQEQVYVNVKKKLEEKQAVIENEEIMEDNSIILTVTI